MLKQSLQQRLLQKLSPQQIQVIKLLELPTLQLEERIKKELEENPVLDEGDSEESTEEDYRDEDKEVKDADKEEFSLEDYMDDDDTPSYKLAAQNYSKDDKHEDIPFSGGTTFHEQLISQLGLRILTPEKAALAEYLIGNIDEDGYLRREIDSIVDDLAFSTVLIPLLRSWWSYCTLFKISIQQVLVLEIYKNVYYCRLNVEDLTTLMLKTHILSLRNISMNSRVSTMRKFRSV